MNKITLNHAILVLGCTEFLKLNKGLFLGIHSKLFSGNCLFSRIYLKVKPSEAIRTTVS